jgi:signal peptidase I
MMIVSKSMEPTIPEGQRVAVDRNAFDDTEPQCGDIVIFEFDSTFRIYRVIGLPGETIEIEAGAVYVNGISLDEPYLANGTRTQSRTDSFEVPNGSYFLLGDNPTAPTIPDPLEPYPDHRSSEKPVRTV